MKPIKIYGESKTGTTYLEHLIRKNTDAEVLECSDWGPLGWKHGFPQSGDALYIFIFRNVYEWVKSLKADKIDKRFKGLQEPFGDCSQKHWKPWNNPIECRTAKYYSYIGFAQLHIHDSILINYDFLRDRPECLYLLRGFKYEVNKKIVDIPNHTYKKVEGKDNPNRKGLTDEERDFIDNKTDKAIEDYINSLSIWSYSFNL